MRATTLRTTRTRIETVYPLMMTLINVYSRSVNASWRSLLGWEEGKYVLQSDVPHRMAERPCLSWSCYVKIAPMRSPNLFGKGLLRRAAHILQHFLTRSCALLASCPTRHGHRLGSRRRSHSNLFSPVLPIIIPDSASLHGSKADTQGLGGLCFSKHEKSKEFPGSFPRRLIFEKHMGVCNQLHTM